MSDPASIKNDLVAFYDAQADERDERGLRLERAGFRSRFMDLLSQEGRTTLIDLGAGTGHEAAAFAAAGIHVVAIDLSPEHVARCRAKGIDARVGDFYAMDFPAHCFQAAWAMSSLLHVPDRDVAPVLAEIVRVLHPAAPLAVGLWGGIDREGAWEGDPVEPKRFFSLRTDDRLRALLVQHFHIEEFETTSPEPESEVHYQYAVVRTPG